MEKSLIELFEKVDGNKDRMMSKDELKDALKQLCETVKNDSTSPLYFILSDVDLSDSNLERITRKAFNEIDTDRSGTITFEEFANSDWTLSL
ncbi:Oidioi.mRNA.OKI2018_I69.chr1.g1326.t1.cds [Oikopleura dioica]|uniref:Oidioi.mRNA.OKI2018_I69.chr1.g1326.t1.cds n=1 Tax=Oikopleura dioica TaxID=34765 RepID=A0ABN7SRU8_OIKDI|nr:Oidioi.mRNA.OKI2018_I69.chr1.g1326.t1.cds [Oikopleura dioica]